MESKKWVCGKCGELYSKKEYTKDIYTEYCNECYKLQEKIKCLYCSEIIEDIDNDNIGSCKVQGSDKIEYWHEKCPDNLIFGYDYVTAKIEDIIDSIKAEHKHIKISTLGGKKNVSLL